MFKDIKEGMKSIKKEQEIMKNKQTNLQILKCAEILKMKITVTETKPKLNVVTNVQS